MPKLLYIESSPRKSRSKSIAVSKAFIDAYQSTHADAEVETLDLWSAEIPEFDGETIDAKYAIMHGQDHSEAQATAWNAVVAMCDQFKSADHYLISVPMWNFGIPYKLKHYIDVIAQPGQTFNASSEGYRGLVTGKPAAVVYARGGSYSEGEAKNIDFQKPYLDFLLGFIGFEEIHSIVVEPTLGSPDDVAKVEFEASAKANEIASSF